MRKQRLSSWFPSCWCSRCSDDGDDVRCFPCATQGCTGMCVASSVREDLLACHVCQASLPNSATLLRFEAQIITKYLGFERDNTTITEKRVEALLLLSQRMLAPRHWARVAIGDMAQDVSAQVYYWGPADIAAPEQLNAYARAVELVQAWCSCWRASVRIPSACVAMKFERAGDLLTLPGRFAEAVQNYLLARSEMACLAMPVHDGRVQRIESKLRAALKGQRNDEQLVHANR